MSALNNQELQQLNELIQAGFEYTHKPEFPNSPEFISAEYMDAYHEQCTPETPMAFLAYPPDKALGHGECGLPGAIVPFYPDQEQQFVYLAMRAEPSKEATSRLYGMGGYCSQTTQGEWWAFVPLQTDESLLAQLHQIKQTGIETKPFPYDRDALSMLPLAPNDPGGTLDWSDAELLKKIDTLLGPKVIDIPPEIAIRRQSQQPKSSYSGPGIGR